MLFNQPTINSFSYLSDIIQEEVVKLIEPVASLSLSITPTYYSFSTFIGIINVKNGDKINIYFKCLDTEEILLSYNFSIENYDNIAGITLNNKNVFFKNYGLYATEIYVNGKIIGNYPIEVKK